MKIREISIHNHLNFNAGADNYITCTDVGGGAGCRPHCISNGYSNGFCDGVNCICV